MKLDRNQRTLSQAPPPAGRAEQHERQHRDDQHLPHLTDVNGHAEQQATRGQLPAARLAAPEQGRDARHNQGLEGDVRHDRLLGLQLITVQQDGGRGHGGRPAPYAAPDEHGVQRAGHRQAEKVLKRGDSRQSARMLQRPQRSPVAERVLSQKAAQVPVRVDVEQRGPVSELGQDPERQPESKKNR